MSSTVDTSVVVAGFAPWHEAHRAARDALDDAPRLAAHAAIESFSVLTRLPAPHRAPPEVVQSFLDLQFREPWLTLSPLEHRALLSTLAEFGVTGGRVYDALVGATAASHALTLRTLDRRAAGTYEALGVDLELID